MYNVERAASVVAAFYSILLGYGSLKKKSLKGICIAKTFFFLITNNVEEGGGGRGKEGGEEWRRGVFYLFNFGSQSIFV